MILAKRRIVIQMAPDPGAVQLALLGDSVEAAVAFVTNRGIMGCAVAALA